MGSNKLKFLTSDGIPRIVQEIRWHGVSQKFNITLFNGKYVVLTLEWFVSANLFRLAKSQGWEDLMYEPIVREVEKRFDEIKHKAI